MELFGKEHLSFLLLFLCPLFFLITKTMPPIALKFSSDAAPFDSESELQKAWQVCTKVKDALDNGSRLENMSWRLWFVRNADNQQQQEQQHYHQDRMQHIMNELWANDNDDNTMDTMVATENKEPVQQQQPTTEVPFTMVDEIQEPEASLSLPSLSPPSNHTTPLFYDAQREYRRLLWQQQLDQLQQLCLHNSLKAIESDASSAAAVVQEQQQITPAPPPTSSSTCHTSSSSKMASCRNAYSIGTIHFPQPQQRTKKASIRRSLPVQSSSSSPVCSNCETTTTPLWRRSADDQLLCNACGL